MIQARTAEALLRDPRIGAEVEIVTVRTSGDRGRREVLGAFVKEIQESLLAGEIDVALHCLKDMPTRPVEALTIGAYLKREDPSETLIYRVEPSLGHPAGLGVSRTRSGAFDNLHPGAIVGTGSIRRTSQLAARRSDLQYRPLVGNVDTRLRKLQAGEYDAIVLATAGLKRMGLIESLLDSGYANLAFETLDILPAPGQGVLVLEVRSGSPVENAIAGLNDLETEQASIAERAFLGCFGTGCSLPIAAKATVGIGQIQLEGLVASPDGRKVLRESATGPSSNAKGIGVGLAKRLRELGADVLINVATSRIASG